MALIELKKRKRGLESSAYRWRLLDDLLMSSLDAAITLVQVDVVGMVIAKDLDFNVSFEQEKAQDSRRDTLRRSVEHFQSSLPWLLDELLNEHFIVVERLASLGLGRMELREEFLGREGDSHTFSTATSDGLDHDWVAWHKEALRDHAPKDRRGG